jgi:hypothetical protein
MAYSDDNQMRYVIVVVSMILAIFSGVLDWGRPSPDSWVCRQGLCRFDQIVSVISSSEGSSSNLASLVTEDPSNPFAWCVYADSLALQGEWDKASAAFDHAITLGPNMSPVLMREANFDFTHDRINRGVVLSNQILRETPAFDEVLFSYLTRSGIGIDKVLGSGIPVLARPAQSWLRWLGINGSDEDVRETWGWMQQNHLINEKSAEDLSWILWRRQSFRTAQELWSDWLGSARGDYLSPELLLNRRLQNSGTEGPFDWIISASPSIKMSRDEGLEIHFSGTENAELMIQQLTSVKSGLYSFSAEIQSEGLTTDQHPFFNIIDAVNRARLDFHAPPIEENMARRKIVFDFRVPPGTLALAIQLIRSKSQRFDNKIEGTLWVFEVSLVPTNHLPK